MPFSMQRPDQKQNTDYQGFKPKTLQQAHYIKQFLSYLIKLGFGLQLVGI
jgi:phosphate starvation-inducible protein PhoH